MSERSHTCSETGSIHQAAPLKAKSECISELKRRRLMKVAMKQSGAEGARQKRQQRKVPPARCIRSARELQSDPRGRRPRAGALEAWQPTVEDVLEVTVDPPGCCWHEQQYSVVAITVAAAKRALAWLLPQLQEVTGARIVGRDGRGASILLTQSWSRSGAHADHMDTLVYCHLGQRKVQRFHAHARAPKHAPHARPPYTRTRTRAHTANSHAGVARQASQR